MPKAKLQAATVGGSPDDIEASFYEALQTGNLDRLMACWADEDEVVCVHPGGQRLLGSAAIRASFEALFANGTLQIKPVQVRRVTSLASAMHNLLEVVNVLTPQGPRHAYVIATNIYHRTPQGWRLVAHHASPGTPHEIQEGLEPSQVLH